MFSHDVVKYTTQHSDVPQENTSPVFFLPGANGESYLYLKSIADKLAWRTWFLEDGRLNPDIVETAEELTFYNKKLTLDQLVMYQIHQISEVLQDEALTDQPVILIGYSCAGIFLNRLIDIIKRSNGTTVSDIFGDPKDEDEREFFRRLNGDMQILKNLFLLPIYVDCIAPSMLNRMDSIDFAKDMIHMLAQMAAKYKGFVLNGALVWDKETNQYKPDEKWPLHDSKVNQLAWLNENLKLRRLEDEPVTASDPVGKGIQSLRREISVMMATYQRMLQFTDSLEVSHGEFMQTRKTCENLAVLYGAALYSSFMKPVKEDFIHGGYRLRKNVASSVHIFEGQDHDSIVEEPNEGIPALVREINGLLDSQEVIDERVKNYKIYGALCQSGAVRRKESDGSELDPSDLQQLLQRFQV